MWSLLLVVVSVLGTGADLETPSSGGPAAFERMHDLVGEWRGSFTWTGARADKGSMGARYYLTGNGSALVEDLLSDGTPTMTTVYHLDGEDLRMTHYCGARNQPRLKARAIDLKRGVVSFAFVDATGLRSADSPHVRGSEIDMVDADHLTISFEFVAGERVSTEVISLERVPGSPPSH
jgi:hypothetical protein